MSTPAQYPPTVVDKILEVTLRSNRYAYLALEDNGALANRGGDLAALGLPVWEIGENILDDALFLAGYVPMTRDYEVIEALQVDNDKLIDAHLFRDQGNIWVILVDKTEDLEWQASARQKGNELRLLKQQLQKEAEADGEPHTEFDFFESLDMLALRACDDGSFERLEPVCEIFESLYPESTQSVQSLYPQRRFPFVENFLVDAAEVWSNSDDRTRLRSGPWVETDADGNEIALEAIALNWKGNRLLFIEVLDESYELRHSLLQTGREGALYKNLLEQEVRKQTREIRAREEEIALRLVCAADSRDDGETGSHIRRLGLYSELLAKNLGWNAADAEEIRIAAPMHDIGKIGIPDHILKKPGKLTADEFEIMKLHPEIGARILSNSSSTLVQMARDICLGHHEKWDGNGYPQGLRGDEIPLAARIVAIVDVFDALIHKRVYKDKIPIEHAIEIMQQGRGKHFDPKLLDLFLELKAQMTEIAFDYSNPIGDEIEDDMTLIGDIHLPRPAD